MQDRYNRREQPADVGSTVGTREMIDHTHAAGHATPSEAGAPAEPGSPMAPASRGGEWLRSRTGLTLLGFLAVAGFFLVTEHRAHLSNALPFLLIFAFLLMHVFMHGGHGGHGAHTGQAHNHKGEQR